MLKLVNLIGSVMFLGKQRALFKVELLLVLFTHTVNILLYVCVFVQYM